MLLAADILTAIIALLHLYFMVLEMFLWEKPVGLRTFGLTPDTARASRTLAANQGLYNGFLATGLLWGLWLGDGGHDIKVFFLVCVVMAGVFGAATANMRIFFVQALPAMAALTFLLFS